MRQSQFLRRTFELAKQAVSNGNHPFGALLVVGERVVLEVENTVCSDRDVTRHAELSLVSAASKRFSKEALEMSTLYSSTEPCAMCAGAIYWAGIPKVVFGCSSETLNEIVPGSLSISTRELFSKSSRPAEILGPFLEPEANQLHLDYWTTAQVGS
jgi:tRNA(Arg) A34 adenosine deaminase TadA